MSRRITIMSLPAIAGIMIVLAYTTNAVDKSARYLFQNDNIVFTGFGVLLLVFSLITNRF
ncbi:MAG: hypothetical protein IH597_10385 [Bacteroidales bacterium]|nr:hypothetical protein [Bacteroidales bacterium]